MPDFSDLGLSQPILAALSTAGYSKPTPIQCQAIPPILSGRDLCGIAQTGTGKTAAFALPILERLVAAPRRPAPQTCRVLVLSPTRELASQIADNFRAYGAGLPLTTAVVFGGVPIGRQRQQLARGIDVLVATPGRLLDLIDTKSLTLSSVQVLVLDEADRMLDLGFVHALRRIVKLLPRPRQTLLFSATMPRAIALLAEDYLDDPVKVVVAPAATTAERIDQGVIFVPSERKRDLLATILQDPAFERVLVFTRTKHGADRVVRHLDAAGIGSAAIHGNKSQPQRERALAGFRDGQARVLVATDIAARGIDVDGVSHVINFELPNVPEDYVHRIGRTARAGADGIAIAFCSDEERSFLRDIQKLTRSPLRPIPAPTMLARSAPAAQSAESAPAQGTAPQPSTSRRPETPRRPKQAPARQAAARQASARQTSARQAAAGTERRRNESTPGESLPAFLRRQPANGNNPGHRGTGRRDAPAARFNGAR
ncbi:MAG: DEAD/DEAH box helicase [Alphaproteobacteria bacterium]|nr:DEAD/DEAH box helicase [Alphaproteobacteria bacterium]